MGVALAPASVCQQWVFVGKNTTAWWERRHPCGPLEARGREGDCPSSAELVASNGRVGEGRQPSGLGKLGRMFYGTTVFYLSSGPHLSAFFPFPVAFQPAWSRFQTHLPPPSWDGCYLFSLLCSPHPPPDFTQLILQDPLEISAPPPEAGPDSAWDQLLSLAGYTVRK